MTTGEFFNQNHHYPSLFKTFVTPVDFHSKDSKVITTKQNKISTQNTTKYDYKYCTTHNCSDDFIIQQVKMRRRKVSTKMRVKKTAQIVYSSQYQSKAVMLNKQ